MVAAVLLMPGRLAAAPVQTDDGAFTRYALLAPDTRSFNLTRDCTEERPGIGAYVNGVRAGNTVSNPSARDLGSGALLTTEWVRGAAFTAIDPRESNVTDATTAVVFRFDSRIDEIDMVITARRAA